MSPPISEELREKLHNALPLAVDRTLNFLKEDGLNQNEIKMAVANLTALIKLAEQYGIDEAELSLQDKIIETVRDVKKELHIQRTNMKHYDQE